MGRWMAAIGWVLAFAAASAAETAPDAWWSGGAPNYDSVLVCGETGEVAGNVGLIRPSRGSETVRLESGARLYAGDVIVAGGTEEGGAGTVEWTFDHNARLKLSSGSRVVVLGVTPVSLEGGVAGERLDLRLERGLLRMRVRRNSVSPVAVRVWAPGLEALATAGDGLVGAGEGGAGVICLARTVTARMSPPSPRMPGPQTVRANERFSPHEGVAAADDQTLLARAELRFASERRQANLPERPAADIDRFAP